MYNTILVPIDMAHLAEGKTIIDAAMEHATDGARIILLNVIGEVPNWALRESYSPLNP